MTRLKKGMGLLLAMSLLALVGVRAAWAVEEQNSDSLTITITPLKDMGVNVDTATVKFALSDTPGDLTVSMMMDAIAYFISPATVTILGNYNNQEVQLSATGLDSWTVDNDETAETNQVQLYALFSVDKASRPVEDEFGGYGGRNQVTPGQAIAGEPDADENNGSATNKYEIADGEMQSGTDMDNLVVGAVKQLWMRVDAPPSSDYEGIQRVQVTLTAVSGRDN
jgi:hypothetical protein